MSETIRVALLPIGRELLTGRVQDTNSAFLAARLFSMGIRVVRICAVDDDVRAITCEIRRSRADGANVIVCTGGLGPTPDDITLRAVGEAIRRPLIEDPQALAHVERRYQELFDEGRVDFPELTPERRKMALIPKGAKILSNKVGTAPGIVLKWGGVRIFCLPGVPSEMRPMAEENLFPFLSVSEGLVVKRLTVRLPEFDESRLAAVIRHLQQEHPGVLMKPDPKGYGLQQEMLVHLECEGKPDNVEQILKAAARDLSAAVSNKRTD